MNKCKKCGKEGGYNSFYADSEYGTLCYSCYHKEYERRFQERMRREREEREERKQRVEEKKRNMRRCDWCGKEYDLRDSVALNKNKYCSKRCENHL